MIRKLGIYAPYTWDVATYMGCTLGDLAAANGLGASYLSYQKHDKGVHSRWDTRVHSSKRQDFKNWAGECSHLVWFGVHKNKLEVARKQGCRNTLVLLWNRLTPTDLPTLKHFDEIVCPNTASYTVAFDKKLHKNILEIPWDSGLRLEDNLRPVSDSRQKILTIAEGPTARKHGTTLFSTIAMLLSAQPDVDLTVCHHSNWSRPALQQLNDLVRDNRDRIKIKRRPDLDWRVNAYGTHHWTWLPNLHSNIGFYGLEALATNCPVLTYDLSPMPEFVRQGYNGHLVYCDQEMNWLGVPQGRMNARALLSGLEEALGSNQYQDSLRKTRWPERQQRRDYFQHAWKKLWELDS